MLVKLKDWKVAKQYQTDYPLLLRVLSLTIRGLNPFLKYKPIKNIVECIQTNIITLEAHHNTAEKILNRGKETNEQK